jgi:hypothetical protein
MILVMPSALAIYEEYIIGGRKISTCLKGPSQGVVVQENDIED